MPRPRFSEMLSQRRHQLGLTIPQASRVIRIKEQVLVAFEEGDFSVIPRSGYAQGMLASYARYLGLNPRVGSDQFTHDLAAFEHGVRRQDAAPERDIQSRHRLTDQPTYELPNTGASTVRRASDHQVVDPSTPAADRIPTAEDGYGRPTSLVRRQAHDGRGHISSFQERNTIYSDGRLQEEVASSDHRYTSRDMSSRTSSREGGRPRPSRGGTRRPTTSSGRPSTGSSRREPLERGEITTRDVRPRQYTDDLRYDDTTSPYEAASTQSGRRSSRNIANPARPNVQRRAPSSSQSQVRNRGRRRQPTRGGVVGALQNYFSDQRRATVTVLVVLVVALVVIISSGVRACTASKTSTTKQVSVATSISSTTTAATTTSSEQQAAEQQALSEAAAKSAAAAAAAASQQTNVKVSVADGQVTWVEIQCDGESKVAETITGPWEQTYVVTSSITIQVGETSAVTVTKNDTQVQFESKASGVGSVTIQGTPAATTEATTETG